VTHLSRNCRDHQEQANRTHDCRGCDCRCHHVPAPANLRAIVEAAKASRRDLCADGVECMARENVGEPCCGRDA
jgi:hypothetical protein